MVVGKKPLQLFYSYASDDKDFIKELETHLSLFVKQGDITTWYRDRVNGGLNYQQEADEQLHRADIVLFLISPSFIACDRCYKVEMVQALERQESGDTRVIPILIRPSQWEKTPLNDLVVLSSQCPVDSCENKDQAWKDVVEGVKKVIDEVSTSVSPLPQHVSPPPSMLDKMEDLPHTRNPLFTGREKLLDELYRCFQADGLPQAISGLGGIGKTQTAVEYAFRYANEYQFIYWIRAETESRRTNDFVSLARKLDLPEKDEQDQNVIIAAVRHWLIANDKWLLIFDNADNTREVSAFLDEVFNGYNLSNAPGGHILLTTRDAVTFVKGHAIEKMGMKDGVRFLLQRANLPANSENNRRSIEIVREMDGLPLALDQAGAYIDERRCSLADYLELYRQEKIALLGRRPEKKTFYPASVATTWSLSFQNVRQASPAAADLLCLCAFLDPDAIPIELISAGSQYLNAPLKQVVRSKGELNDAIRELLKYSLVGRNKETLNIHRLVQVVLRDTTLDGRAQRDWARCVVSILAAAFPAVMRTDWGHCQLYLPHALLCDTLIKDYSLVFPEAISLLNNAGLYLQERALYKPAKALLQHAHSISTQSPDLDRGEVAITYKNLAALYLVQRKLGDAERNFNKALKMIRALYGPDHPDVATILDNLGTLYCMQWNYEQAETHYRRALAMRKSSPHLDDQAVATTLDNLGTLYRLQGKYREAERHYKEADALKEKLLGAEHRDRATTLNNLGQICYLQGRYDEAHLYYNRVLKMRKKLLGSDHTDTATVLDYLGTLYSTQGKYKEAEQYYKNTCTIREKRLGAEHPDMAITLDNLGTLYRLQRKYKEARELYEQALVIRKSKLDPEHPDIATTLDNLGTLYRLQEKYRDAEMLYKQALVIREGKLDPEHPDIATTLDNLGTLYRLQGRSALAETFYRKALSIREEALGFEHPDTASTLHNIACIHQTRGQRFYARAEDCYRKCLFIREKMLGIGHPEAIEAFKDLISLLHLFRSQRKHTQATELQRSRHAYALSVQSSGSDHPDTIKAFEKYLQMVFLRHDDTVS